MSISGVGSANSYIYENVNKSNNRNKGTALFDQSGITTTSWFKEKGHLYERIFQMKNWLSLQIFG